MLAIRRLRLSFLFVLFTTAGFGQKAPELAPLPSDSFELVAGATHVPGTPQERGQALDLLEHARQNSDLHAAGSPAFSMRINFSSQRQRALYRFGRNGRDLVCSVQFPLDGSPG